MKTTESIATNLRQVYFGGNWSWSNMKTNLSDVTLKEATTKVFDLNTIATLAFHIHYYVNAVGTYFDGERFESKDEYSFKHPVFANEDEWQDFIGQMWKDAEKLAAHIEKLPDNKLQEIFIDEKYGTYFRNLFGIIEHTHYHLGQIALIKKMLRQTVK
jgi:hypothetical protein